MNGLHGWKLCLVLPVSAELGYNTAKFPAGSNATIRAAGNWI